MESIRAVANETIENMNKDVINNSSQKAEEIDMSGEGQIETSKKVLDQNETIKQASGTDTEDVVASSMLSKNLVPDINDNSHSESSCMSLLNILDKNTNTSDKAVLTDVKREESFFGCSYTRNEDLTEYITQRNALKGNVDLFAEDTGPQMYNAKGSLVTPPIITKNLPKAFEYLPIFGKPEGDTPSTASMKDFYTSKIREYVGCDLSDYEFNELEKYCSPEHLKTGKELVMGTKVPVMGVVSMNIIQNNHESPDVEEPADLCILKKNKMRIDKDNKGLFTKKLKYRGVRVIPFTKEIYPEVAALDLPINDLPDADLEPGKDVLYRVRVYRPYAYSQAKDRYTRSRHSVFICDIFLTGRNKLSDLRDRFVCHNDFDMRVDVSNHPDMLPNTKAKEVFPSGFLFINNVFYVDTRDGCIDYSEPIRSWAAKKKIGLFPKKDMCSVTLGELVLKLGYPEVYVHQGNCEHVFLFSEVRLLNPTDPLKFSKYPCSTAIAQNQTMYCTTCAEFSAKWIVVGCVRVPFDPAFFCDACFKQYLYKNAEKIGDFKAYSYRGNALNVLKPQ